MFTRLIAKAVAGSAAFGLALASPMAQAQSDPGTPAIQEAATTKAEHDRIVAYWTAERMRTAVPGDALVAGRNVPRTAVVDTGRPHVEAASNTGEYYTGGGQVARTTGKVFFTLDRVNYVCSGSSVTSTNHDVVLTAGHCLNEGPGAYATNFAFVPAYDDGARPYGTFTARALVTTTEWKDAGDFNYDVGFAVMNSLNGTDLTDTVGTQGIGFNLARGSHMYSFGYPAAKPYDGTEIAWCHGTVSQDTFGGSSDQGLDCNLTGGSSGGPWFTGYTESTGVGTLNSVNSFKYRAGPYRTYMWGPYFGSVIQSLYNTAQGL